MAYVAPPTFVDSNVLLASQLNTLGDDIAFLYSKISGANIPFVCEETAAGGGFTYVYKIRHMHRYLHYKMRQIASDSDSISIEYDNTTIYSDGGNRTAPYTWSGYIDLDSTPGGLTIGDDYEIQAHVAQVTGSGVTFLDYFLESDSTTI